MYIIVHVIIKMVILFMQGVQVFLRLTMYKKMGRVGEIQLAILTNSKQLFESKEKA